MKKFPLRSMEKMGDASSEFPTDILIVIFSYLKQKYSDFRVLNKSCREAFISWDGWDSLIAQGVRVRISSTRIEWHKTRDGTVIDDKMLFYLHMKRDFPKSSPLTMTYHRDPKSDLPAIEYINGTKNWYKNGELHRENGLPAIQNPDGQNYWFFNGKLHRSGDLPAIEKPSGTQEWYLHGVLHREGDLPAVENVGVGYAAWYFFGKLMKRRVRGKIFFQD